MSEVYALSSHDLYGGDVKAGDEYLVNDHGDGSFSFTVGEGRYLFCLWNECAHLSEVNGEWKRVEK